MCCDQTCATDWGLFVFQDTTRFLLFALQRLWDSSTKNTHCGGLQCFLEIPWSLAAGLQIPVLVHACRTVKQHTSHIKLWLRKGNLGVASVSPQFSPSLACNLSFHYSFRLYSAAFINDCLHNLRVATQFCGYSLMSGRARLQTGAACWCVVERSNSRIWQICSSTQQVSLSLIDTHWKSCFLNMFCFSSSHIVIRVARLTSKFWILYFI